VNTKIFDNIMENNFEGKIPSKDNFSTPKSDLFEFRNLIKEQGLQSKTKDSKPEQKRIETSEHEHVSETHDPKQDNVGAQTDDRYTDVIEISAITNLPTIERDLLLEEAASFIETTGEAVQEKNIIEEDVSQEQELDQSDKKDSLAIHLVETPNKPAELMDSIDNIIDKENIVAPLSASNIDQFVDSENINDKSVSEPFIISRLSDHDQTINQRLKTFELSNGFTPVTETLTDQSLTKQKGVSELEALSTKLETPIKLVVENESRKNVPADIKPIVTIPSPSLVLADTTKLGKEVISKMQAHVDDNQASESALKVEDFILNNEASLLNLSDKNNSSAEQKKSLLLESFGTIVEQTSDTAFEITFEGHNNGLKRSEMPKPSMQISLAIREILNTNTDSGKKQITIHLHPHTLGAVKVEILSQMGLDGISKIENIKISADKHETLMMLEERKIDLSRSLKEVNGAQEKEASLQFEMSQDQGRGQGAYFASAEERDNWMSKFVGLISNVPADEKHIHLVDEYATRGIVTEDKIDLIA